jgi:hypothetical protein
MTTPAIALALKCGLCEQFDGKIVRPYTVTPELYVRQLEEFYMLAKADMTAQFQAAPERFGAEELLALLAQLRGDWLGDGHIRINRNDIIRIIKGEEE